MTMASKKSYVKREDGEERANVAIWVRLTRDQVAAIERFADAAGTLSPKDLLTKIAEEAIEKAIAANGKGLPSGRESWASRKVR
jgi:hypothetical protein